MYLRKNLFLALIVLVAFSVVSCDKTTNPDNGDDPTDGALVINEFLASNDTGETDEAGEFEDWVELFNGTDAAIDLAGYTLTDDLDVPDAWTFPADPACVIEAGGYLVIWCDKDLDQGVLHAEIKLSSGGEDVGLFDVSGTMVDGLTYEAQITDISYGRVTDGASEWTTFESPTMGSTNN